MTLIAQIGYPQTPCTLHSPSPPNSLRLKTTRGWSSARSTWWGAGGGMSQIPPFPRTIPGRSVTPARCIVWGAEQVQASVTLAQLQCLNRPGPTSVLFLAEHMGQGRPSSSQWPRICGAPAVSDAAARGRYCTQRAAGSFLRGGGWVPTSNTRRPGTPPRTQDRPPSTVTSAIDC